MSSINKIHENFVPKSWWKVRVQDVLKTSSGGTPSTNRKDFWTNGDIPWINSGALKDDIVENPVDYITQLGLKNSSAKLFPKNTVLVALTGSTTGKVGVLQISCTTNQSIVGIYPSKYLLPRFIFYYFISIRNNLLSQAIGSAQPHINKHIIDETLIPIPPIEHQEQVVDLLEKASAKIQSVNQQSREIETLEETAFKGFIYNGDVLYPSVKLGSYCKERSERAGQRWKGKRLIGVSKDNGIVDLRVNTAKSFEKYKIVMPGDFIYNPMRVDIGSIALFEDNQTALTSPDYIVFTIEHTLSHLLLLTFLKSSIGLSLINSNTQGSVRSRLYFKNLSQIEFPFNGSEQQIEAQTILEGFKKMKEEVARIQKSLKQIFADTLQRVFRGEYVNNKKFALSGKEIAALMKEEKELSNNVEKLTKIKNDKPFIMKRTTNKINVLEFITSVYGNNRFTFETLYAQSGLQYETLKLDLYELIDKKIQMEFSVSDEKMYFKLK